MSDNVTANAGSGGPSFATDDIGGVHYPRTKISHGADGSATDVSAASPLPVTPSPATSNGLSIFRSIDLDETEEEVKSSAGQVYAVFITNFATSTRYVKFYNATAANVTVGTTTPVITLAIPGNASDDTTLVWNGGGMGLSFSAAISVAATTGLADNDTGAPSANDVLINVFYK